MRLGSAVKRILVTGACGFVGGHLIASLNADPETLVFGTTRRPPTNREGGRQLLAADRLKLGDLVDAKFADEVVRTTRPDWVVHLAAQASVSASWQDPSGTLVNNLVSQLNVLEGISRHAPAARILVVGSSEEYGKVGPEDSPLSEDAPLRPDSPYATSKVAQDFLGLQYYLGRQLQVLRVRQFNLIGPGQSDRFALPSFARQIAEVEAGLREPVIQVGNLDACRDFTDVRDAVRAYIAILERGRVGEVYNVGGGSVRSVRELLDALCSLARCPLGVAVDPARLRPSDAPIIQSDCRKIRGDVGWSPVIPIERTLRDILDEWRGLIGDGASAVAPGSDESGPLKAI